MTYCRTSVSVKDAAGKHAHFEPCGKPATQTVSVGLKVCHYCDEHAADARGFVEQQGQASIADIQRRTGVA